MPLFYNFWLSYTLGCLHFGRVIWWFEVFSKVWSLYMNEYGMVVTKFLVLSSYWNLKWFWEIVCILWLALLLRINVCIAGWSYCKDYAGLLRMFGRMTISYSTFNIQHFHSSMKIVNCALCMCMKSLVFELCVHVDILLFAFHFGLKVYGCFPSS